MTELEKMLDGQPFDGAAPEIIAYQNDCRAAKDALDAIPISDMEGRSAALTNLVGSMKGPAVVLPPFFVEYGKHIHLGHWAFINTGATFLDCGTVTIGDYVAVGPNVQFITVNHPKRPEDRHIMRDSGMPPFAVMTTAKPIVVKDHAWIGAGAIIMPGVTIGAGAVVGAGSVVTKDVPDRMVAVGNPARVVKSVDD